MSSGAIGRNGSQIFFMTSASLKLAARRPYWPPVRIGVRTERAGRDRSEERTSRRLKESGEEWEGLVDGAGRQLGERTTASDGVRHEGRGVGEDRRVRHQAAVRLERRPGPGMDRGRHSPEEIRHHRGRTVLRRAGGTRVLSEEVPIVFDGRPRARANLARSRNSPRPLVTARPRRCTH